MEASVKDVDLHNCLMETAYLADPSALEQEDSSFDDWMKHFSSIADLAPVEDATGGGLVAMLHKN